MPKPTSRDRGVPTGVMRARQADLDIFDEAARRLSCRPRDAVTFAADLLARELGLDRDRVVDIREALARGYGDDGVIDATLKLDPLGVELTIAGTPLEGFTGHVFVAFGEHPPVILSDARIGMVHDATRTHFHLGVIPSDEIAAGASVRVRVGALEEHWVQPRYVTAANVESVRQDMRLRGTLRRDRGEDDDPDDA